MSDEIKITKSAIYIFGIILLIVIAGFFIFKNSKNLSNNTINNSYGETQKVVIGIKNYNYYPNTIKVEAGKPVSISLDKSVVGCYRGFTIRELGLAKYLATPEDTLEFTPTKKGTYVFACSMGMGRGTLIIE